MSASAKQELMPAVQPEDSSGALLSVIERAAANPNIDVEKMERLLSMQERVLNRQAEQAFNEAMQAAQKDMPQIVRDAENKDNHSKYARLETVVRAINPVITKNGFSMSFGTDQSPLDKHYRVTCIVSHAAGHSRTYHADIPADLVGLKGNPNKTATHAFGSTMSYGRRYLTLLIFNVATRNEDDDGNAAGGDVISEEQVTHLQRLVMDCDADLPKFLAFLKVEKLTELPAHRYDKAVAALNDWAAKAARKP